MNPFVDPAAAAFVDAASRQSGPVVFGEVQVARVGSAWELRHTADAGERVASLQEVDVDALQEIAQRDHRGEFRPNKTAPNLRRGWVARVMDAAGLETAFRGLYPGALADWFAASKGAEGAALENFLGRQTGMFRSLRHLAGAQVKEVADAGCAREFCLRRRLWKMAGIDPVAKTARSEIPCFEPCGLLLEMLRRASKGANDAPVAAVLNREDWESTLAALDKVASLGNSDGREGDFSDPVNPRRARMAADRIRAAVTGPGGAEGTL
jgi:4Fe-4S iron-sulfur cluster binding domain/DR2241 stabilising domain